MVIKPVYNGNDANIVYEYDLGSRLRRLTNNIGDTNVIDFNYADYDKVGNRLGMKIDSGPNQVYEYDKLYQLVFVDYNDGNETGYHYDTLGNRIDVNDGTSAAYIRNALNQYTSVGGTNYTYDKNGNLTNDGVRTYTYDCENRLIRAGGLLHNYKYDYRGRLVKGRYTINLRFTYDGDQVITEYIDSSGALLGKYIYGPGIDEPICRIHVYGGEETKYYYHFDGLGSVVALSDENANIAEKYTYDVYGKPVIRGPGGEPRTSSWYYNRYMFTGRDYDTSTGLYYYRARWYNPDIGRFLQTDPLGYYYSMNLYAYCFNNPIICSDPLGLYPPIYTIPGGGVYMPKPVPPGEGCRACARRVRDDWGDEPDNFVRHCGWSCEVKEECGGMCAFLVGWGHEAAGIWGGGASWEDIVANNAGREIACNSGKGRSGNCRSQCEDKGNGANDDGQDSCSSGCY